MKLSESMAMAAKVQSNARGPKKYRQWQKQPPPENPVADPVRPGTNPTAPVIANPVPVLAGTGIPQRPLPPIAIGSDALRQFDNSGNVPRRRVFGPNPL